MKKIILLLILIFPIINVNADSKCPDGYKLEGEWCTKYTNTVKESNMEICMQGTKVTVEGKKKCQIKVKPTSSDNKEQQKDETSKESEKNEVQCSRSDNKECVCSNGYALEGNWCVKYTIAFKESNVWQCAKGTRVKKDGKEQCKESVKPTLQEKKQQDNNVNSTTPSHEKGDFEFCNEDGVLKTFQIVSYLIMIIKILVPLLLIIFGSIDLGKAVIAGDDKAIQAASKMLVTRAIGGIIIFFIPTIINFAVGLVASWSSVENEFKNCQTCLNSASKCVEKRKAICAKEYTDKTCTWDDQLGSCNCVEK